ncbi:MAG: hypothetical protein A4E28_02622 [Methanocella sp. PtaU1.Bin125]|nr:MAG: hypothetical protein A4E28_02622 [Methanocella sp. PtaU1.Bin125]
MMRIWNFVICLIVIALLAGALTGTALAQAGNKVTATPKASPVPAMKNGMAQGIMLPQGKTLGPGGQIMDINKTPTVVPGRAYNSTDPKAPGGPQGIMLPPGMTLGPYGKVMPANQTPTVTPRPGASYMAPDVPGGPGITLPAGKTLGPYGQVISISPAPTVAPTPTMTASPTARQAPATGMAGKPAATKAPSPGPMKVKKTLEDVRG